MTTTNRETQDWRGCISQLCHNQTQADLVCQCLDTTQCKWWYILAAGILNYCLGSALTDATPGPKTSSISATIPTDLGNTDSTSTPSVRNTSPLDARPTSPNPPPSILSIATALSKNSGHSDSSSTDRAKSKDTVTHSAFSSNPTHTSLLGTSAATAQSGASPRSHSSVAEIVSACVGCLLFLILLISACFCVKRINRRRRIHQPLNKKGFDKPPSDWAIRDSPAAPASATSSYSVSGEASDARIENANSRGHPLSCAEREDRPLLRRSTASTALLGSSACFFISIGREHESYVPRNALSTEDILATIPPPFTREQPIESMESGRSSTDGCSDEFASFTEQSSTEHRDTAMSDEITMSESNLSGWHPSRMVRNPPRSASVRHAHEDDATSTSLELINCRDTGVAI
ncbi:hypothetical protein GY45DRAFT_1329967 [Cubamyces sp. BRFM 1775]|nr:hypothetical protein GY45DRAFT_1329967 [Cubamyces sp. BRFM 1775]